MEGPGAEGITRNVSGPDSDLVATTSGAGNVRVQLTNLHGDVAASIDPGLTSPEFYSFDEFGMPANGQAQQRYGWLGGKQRSGDALGGLVLMGVRLYSPALGRFLQVDPVPGGSATPYDYCFADPINCFDLDGHAGFWRKVGNFCKKALDNPIVRGVAVGLVVGLACVGTAGIGCAVAVGVVAGAALGGANWYVNHRKESVVRHVGIGAASGAFAGGRAFYAANWARRFTYTGRHAPRTGAVVRHVWRNSKHMRRGPIGRYVQARKKFSASMAWAAKRLRKYRKYG